MGLILLPGLGQLRGVRGSHEAGAAAGAAELGTGSTEAPGVGKSSPIAKAAPNDFDPKPKFCISQTQDEV